MSDKQKQTFVERIPSIAKGFNHCATPEALYEWVKQQLEYAYEFGHADAEEKQLKEMIKDQENQLKKIDREIATIKSNAGSQIRNHINQFRFHN